MATTRRIARIITGMHTNDGAGVRLRRYIAQPGLDQVDPFLLLDEFRTEHADDYIAGFPPHPHRGFETVTYMVHGRMRHRDSTGGEGLLEPGSVQWMTAGRGIIHSEMPEQVSGLMWGYQLWVNLPAAQKMHPARYQDIPAERLPVHEHAGVAVKVIAGDYAGVKGAAETLTDVTFLDVTQAAHTPFSLPVASGHAALVVALTGDVRDSADTVLEAGRIALLERDGEVALRTLDSAARFLLITGAPLGEPIARHGPFVMNTQDEIRTAIEDYQAGRLA